LALSIGVSGSLKAARANVAKAADSRRKILRKKCCTLSITLNMAYPV
jgi:hypothetical protein